MRVSTTRRRSVGQHPTGEKQNEPFQLSFNASLKVDSQGSRVTSDGGLVLVRELDERLGLGELTAERLSDSRRGKNAQLPLADLFRQSVYSRVAGYEDVNDAERPAQDPTFRLVGSEKVWDCGFESTCYHPLLLFNREGDCLAAKLRPGNVHSAEGWEEMPLPEIERKEKAGKEVVFRADAAFAKPEICEALEE